jgi:RNA polymerase sigma-70 factor (ECF subfamily)
VLALCVRMTGDRERATELVQDVFVRVWRKLHALHTDDDAGAWLWRVARNVVLNDERSRRRRDRRLALGEDVELAAERLAARASPAMATPLPAKRVDLAAAVERLPERAREVYVLHDVEGFATEEIAARLGIAPATVRVQLHRARGQLRARLSP